jgi:hypothetical protein
VLTTLLVDAALLDPGVFVFDNTVHHLAMAAVDRGTREWAHTGVHSRGVVSGDFMNRANITGSVLRQINDTVSKTITLERAQGGGV